MNQNFFQLDMLNSPAGLAVALMIGLAFGVSLEIGGFGSSKVLSGVFYFRDLRVIKVMTGAMLTAMLGILILRKAGIIAPGAIHILPTFYLASALGGLLFGVGFVTGGWCPGTAAVGMASGKIDAWVFIFGSMIGVVIYALAYPWIKGIYVIGAAGEATLFSLGRPEWVATVFVLVCAVVLAAVESFDPDKHKLRSKRILKNRGFLMFLLFLAAAVLTYQVMPAGTAENRLSAISAGKDHIEPEVLVDALMTGKKDLLLVDVRSAEEYRNAHIPGAIHVRLDDLANALAAHKNNGTIVLYSNGMTHPAQAQEILRASGVRNILILTDGFIGFQERIAKPLSLRNTPSGPQDAARLSWYQKARKK